ncbi:DUF4396 domain-containing protein [Erwinia endophytica]|uniref:DUF4396 domain-containing protein n=1 Tax=Erwinia endophytica TaxID=1563158 RepID=UPI001265E87D|nr:DUF4396 domain-containing protein [Erwinia endophytica]KAB8313274.1 DUF4396 domain-containing protein [Erwinia endophytica]
MLDRLAMLFILLGICTSLMILKDLIRTPQSVWIMNLVWPLTGLYMPFFGWLAWWYFARQRRPVSSWVSQKNVRSPGLNQLFSATSHCAAGCVLGDIISASIISQMDYIPFHSVVLAFALISLLLSFLLSVLLQFFALRQVEGISVLRALWRAIKSDIFSLFMFQLGAFLYMALAFRFILHGQIEPLELHFWFMIQLALFTGFVFAWPANKFLLQRGIKLAF